MSDSLTKDPDIVKLQPERIALFREQAEWYRLNAGKLRCDCSRCINARAINRSEKIKQEIDPIIVVIQM